MAAYSGLVTDNRRCKIQFFHNYAGFFEHLLRKFVRVIFCIINMADTAVDKHFAAKHARMRGAVNFCAADIDAVHSSLNDNILLCMQSTAYFVPLARWNAQLRAQAAHLKSVRNPRRRTIVPRGKDAFVLYRHCAHLAPRTRRTPAHQVRDVHKIFRPRHSLHNTPVC